MKHVFLRLPLLILLSIIFHDASAQNVAINNDGSLPDVNAILDIRAAGKGLLIPRMDSGMRKAIPHTIGLLVYDSTTHSFWYNNGTGWQNLSTGFHWMLGGNAGTNALEHFIGTTDAVPLNIRVKNTPSGSIDHVRNSTFWGYDAGSVNTGMLNTGI